MDEHQLRVAINAQLVSFAQSYRNAGVSRYTFTLLQGLSRLHGNQHYTALVNADEATLAAQRLDAAKMRIVPSTWATGRPLERVLWEQAALPTVLRGVGADVFHAPVNVLPERLPCAAVVTVHDLAFLRYPRYFRPTRRVYQSIFARRSARAATVVVAVSESTKRDILAAWHIPEQRVRVVYPAIGEHFQPATDAARLAAFRAEHHLPDRYLLYLGTLEPRKHIATLVEAYARLLTEEPDTPHLVIAGGKGWYYQALLDQVRHAGLERRVTFAGYVAPEEQPLWYAAAELFIYPSVYEGFGLPVVEALACGTPTITSNVSSLPEAAGRIAVQCQPGSVDVLAHAMHEVLADSTARARTSADGPRWARHFSLQRMAAAYADVYRDAAELAQTRVGKWRR